MSPVGTFETCRLCRATSKFEGKAENILSSLHSLTQTGHSLVPVSLIHPVSKSISDLGADCQASLRSKFFRSREADSRNQCKSCKVANPTKGRNYIDSLRQIGNQHVPTNHRWTIPIREPSLRIDRSFARQLRTAFIIRKMISS